MTYAEWCEAIGIDHAHCSDDCEHPQPFVLVAGVLVCGRCWFVRKVRTEMLPCTPDVCGEGGFA